MYRLSFWLASQNWLSNTKLSPKMHGEFSRTTDNCINVREECIHEGGSNVQGRVHTSKGKTDLGGPIILDPGYNLTRDQGVQN